MKTAVRKHLGDVAAIVVLVVVSAFVAVFVLSHQRLNLPGWVPLVGQDFYELKAEFTTAQAVTPGQGQTVDVAGVPVGEISSVELKDGRALVGMRIKPKYKRIYSNATALLRPRTGLKDMVVELDPGTSEDGGEQLQSGSTIPVSQTAPDVNLDEILSALDADSRDYLQLLVHGAGQGLKGQGANLREAFKRFDPTARDLAKINTLLAERRGNIRRSIHNFGEVTGALAAKDKDLARLIDSSNAVFDALASQEANLRRTVALLPGALQSTNAGLEKTDRLARVLGPALSALRPGARALGPSLVATRPFLRETTPIVRDELRPFARETTPTLKLLTPATKNLAASSGDLTTTFKVVNQLVNELAYDPPGNGVGDQGFLFFNAWTAHNGNSLFSTQDAAGPIRRGLLMADCTGLGLLSTAQVLYPDVRALVPLLNIPDATKAMAAGGC
jgi:phospholipid/cholesterol/gamma-HCH transport system substrate-binding protein